MGEPRFPALTWLGDHGKEAVALVAGLATALFAITSAVFYGSLDVGIRDVGLGPAELLAQAAIGIVTVVALVVFLIGAFALIYRWSRGFRQDNAGPWDLAIGMGAVGALALSTAIVGFVIAAEMLSSPAALLPWGVLIGVALVVGLVFREGRKDAGGEVEMTTRHAVAVLATTILLIALVGLSAVTAVQDASYVRRGVPPGSVFHPLAGGPAPCVNVTWLGDTRPITVPERAMHLGEAGGRVVLYVPGRGPVRLPASEVIVSPAGGNACRLR